MQRWKQQYVNILPKRRRAAPSGESYSSIDFIFIYQLLQCGRLRSIAHVECSRAGARADWCRYAAASRSRGGWRSARQRMGLSRRRCAYSSSPPRRCERIRKGRRARARNPRHRLPTRARDSCVPITWIVWELPVQDPGEAPALDRRPSAVPVARDGRRLAISAERSRPLGHDVQSGAR